MKTRELERTALLLVDLQKGLSTGEYYGMERNNTTAESKILQLLQSFRNQDLPVIHVRHSSQDPNSPLHHTSEGFQFIDDLAPANGEQVITKQVNSAFIGTDLQARLIRDNIDRLIVAGLTTNHCISTSVRMGANLGFEIMLPHDATAAFSHTDWQGTYRTAEEIHLSALAHLDREFAQITSVSDILKDVEGDY